MKTAVQPNDAGRSIRQPRTGFPVRGALSRKTHTIDLTWLLVGITLLVLFASISVVGALRRIATATEKTAADLEALLAAVQKTDIRP